jgi:hypothetical protein
MFGIFVSKAILVKCTTNQNMAAAEAALTLATLSETLQMHFAQLALVTRERKAQPQSL